MFSLKSSKHAGNESPRKLQLTHLILSLGNIVNKMLKFLSTRLFLCPSNLTSKRSQRNQLRLCANCTQRNVDFRIGEDNSIAVSVKFLSLPHNEREIRLTVYSPLKPLILLARRVINFPVRQMTLTNVL